MNKLAAVVVSLLVASWVYAGGNETPEALAERFIAKEKDQWFIIVPMLNKENLKKYEEIKKSQK
jgi:hypothetical protein